MFLFQVRWADLEGISALTKTEIIPNRHSQSIFDELFCIFEETLLI